MREDLPPSIHGLDNANLKVAVNTSDLAVEERARAFAKITPDKLEKKTCHDLFLL